MSHPKRKLKPWVIKNPTPENYYPNYFPYKTHILSDRQEALEQNQLQERDRKSDSLFRMEIYKLAMQRDSYKRFKDNLLQKKILMVQLIKVLRKYEKS